jgi:pyruvate/2-oxoglutarate dehydrogenase complex dihydrolipoamide acyltransferase (E2) component
MKKAILILMTLATLLAVPAQAGSHKAPRPTPTPTPDPRLSPLVQRIASELQITADEVVHTSNEDLRKLYEKLFAKQGLGFSEAKQKAAAVQLKN